MVKFAEQADASTMSIQAYGLPVPLLSRIAEGALDVSSVRPVRVLVVADAQGMLHTATQLLPQSGWPISTIYEEGHALANVLAHSGEHNLLLVRGPMSSAFCLTRLIERLRQLHYQGCVTYCARGLTPEVAAAYKAVQVDRCLQPPQAHGTLIRVVEWLQGAAAPPGPGLSIFEM